MINAREELLSKIEAGLNPLQSRAKREKSVETRLSSPSKHVIPKRAQLDRAKRILLFQQMAEEVAATTSRVSSLNELPETIIEYLNRHNLPSHIKTDTNIDPKISKKPSKMVPEWTLGLPWPPPRETHPSRWSSRAHFCKF